jgi:hypothetical protein
MSDVDLEERIRASLARRAGSVHVEPDLAGLADQTAPRRVRAQRYPLAAVAVVLATLAVTSVALGQGYRESNVMLRSGHRTDRAEDPTTTTGAPGSTSAPKKAKRPATTTTTGSTPSSPTTATQPAPDGTGSGSATDPATLPPAGADAVGDDTTSGHVGPPADCIRPVGPWMHWVDWSQDSHLALVDLGVTGSTRRIALYVPIEGPGAEGCFRRVVDDHGTDLVLEVSTAGNSETEIHTLGCRNPLLVIPDGSTADGVTWTFHVREINIHDGTATVVTDRDYTFGQGESGNIDFFRRLDCDDSTSI